MDKFGLFTVIVVLSFAACANGLNCTNCTQLSGVPGGGVTGCRHFNHSSDYVSNETCTGSCYLEIHRASATYETSWYRGCMAECVETESTNRILLCCNTDYCNPASAISYSVTNVLLPVVSLLFTVFLRREFKS